MKDIGFAYLREAPIPDSELSGNQLTGQQPQRFRQVFTFSKQPKSFEGTQKLAQMISKILLTKPGSDQFSPGKGVDIRGVAGTPLGKNEVGSIRQDIIVTISLIERQIIQSQRDLNLDPRERLSEIIAERIEYDFNRGAWDIRVRVISEAGGNIPLDIGRFLTKE